MLNRQEINSVLLTFFLFINTLVLPLKLSLQGRLIELSGILLIGLVLIISILNDKITINKRFLITFLVLNSLFLINIFVVVYQDIVLDFYIDFLIYSIVGLYLTMKDLDNKMVLKSWYILGLINFGIWLLYLDLIESQEIGYMAFGTSITLSFLIIFYRCVEKKKVYDLLILILCYFIIAIFANRGAFLAINLIMIIMLIYKIRKNRLLLLGGALALFVLSIYDFKTLLINTVVNLNNYLNSIGVNSYSMSKFSDMLMDGLVESSSGRDVIYESAYQILSTGLIPRGIGYFQYHTLINYPHNLFFDMLIIFGFLSIPIILAIGIYIILFFIKEQDHLKKEIVLMLLVVTTVRLSISSTFVYETTFWIVIGLLLNSKFIKKNNYDVRNNNLSRLKT